MKIRKCDQCEEIMEEDGNYSEVEVKLHYEKCHWGDGKLFPIEKFDKEFCSLDCSSKWTTEFLLKVKKSEKVDE